MARRRVLTEIELEDIVEKWNWEESENEFPEQRSLCTVPFLHDVAYTQHTKNAHLGALMGDKNFFSIFLVLWWSCRTLYDFFFFISEKKILIMQPRVKTNWTLYKAIREETILWSMEFRLKSIKKIKTRKTR